jgi:hypothetical protein
MSTHREKTFSKVHDLQSIWHINSRCPVGMKEILEVLWSIR